MNTPRQYQINSEVFHQRAEEYDSWFDDSLLFDIEAAAIDALVVAGQSPALEIGVGPGRFASKFASSIGIDPARSPLHIAHSRGIAVSQAIGEELPFLSNSILRVSLFFTLCFLQNPTEVLRESHRVLKKSGNFILGFVPASGPWGKSLQQKKEAGHPFYEHACFYSIKEIEALLINNGFSITDSVSSLYQIPGRVTQMEMPKTGMDESSGFVVLKAERLRGQVKT